MQPPSPTFHPAPSVDEIAATKISVAKPFPRTPAASAFPSASTGDVPKELGLDRAALEAAGFEGKLGQSLVIPRAGGPALIAVGIGPKAERDLTSLRHAAAAFARAGSHYAHLAAVLPDLGSVAPEVAAQALVEGVLLARYRYRPAQAHDPAGAAARGAHARVAVAAARQAEARHRARPHHRPGRGARARSRQRAGHAAHRAPHSRRSPRSSPPTRGSTSRSSTRRRWPSSAAAACSASTPAAPSRRA